MSRLETSQKWTGIFTHEYEKVIKNSQMLREIQHHRRDEWMEELTLEEIKLTGEAKILKELNINMLNILTEILKLIKSMKNKHL